MFCQQDMIVVVDDSLPSKMLQVEYERSWSQNHSQLEHMDTIRCEIEERANVIFVDRDDYSELEKYRIPRVLPKYPAYKWGFYSNTYQFFDERSFNASGSPLRSLKYCVDSYFFDSDLSEWDVKTEQLIAKHNTRCLNIIYNFLFKNNIEGYYEWFEYEEMTLENAEAKFGHLKGFPELPKLILPPKPELIKPWRE